MTSPSDDEKTVADLSAREVLSLREMYEQVEAMELDSVIVAELDAWYMRKVSEAVEALRESGILKEREMPA